MNDLQSLDEEEFDQIETQAGMASLQEDIAAEERQAQEQRDAKRFKKINQIFDQNASHEKQLSQTRQKNYQAKKQKLMEALMQQNATPSSDNTTKDQLQHFFENPNVESNPTTSQGPSKSQQILDDFAQKPTPEDTTEPAKNQDSKQALFDDFFGGDTPASQTPKTKDTQEDADSKETDQQSKSANQKKIDDFFND